MEAAPQIAAPLRNDRLFISSEPAGNVTFDELDGWCVAKELSAILHLREVMAVSLSYSSHLYLNFISLILLRFLVAALRLNNLSISTTILYWWNGIVTALKFL